MADIKINRRNNCRVCGGTDLRRWVHLPNMPLTDDLCFSQKSTNEFLYDIDVYYCCSCNTSQILHDIDYGEYYIDYNYTVAGSQLATSFMSKLARATFTQYRLPKDCTVIEVGSGDGTQLSCFKELGARVFGYEPSAALCRVSEAIGVPVYQGLFTSNSIEHITEEYRPADVLLLTYTFDHIPEPIDFLETARRIINPKTGLLIMEVHDLEKIMERREYCLFEHEHSIYLSAGTMQSCLHKCGFELISTNLLPEAERRGNSLLIVAADASSVYKDKALPPIDGNHMGKWSKYEAFSNELNNGIKRLDSFINSHIAAGRRVAGYGAGGRGVMTLAAMSSASKLSYLCDRNPRFHGCVTPKSHVPIVSPTMLSQEPVDVLLVFSFGYIDEIRKQLSTLPNAPSKIVSLLEVL